LLIVSFNLQVFVAPPETAFDDPAYSPARWSAKTGFVREMLERLAPDVVVFQEVFSIEALRNLCAECGLPHFTTAGVLPVQGPVPGNYVNAVNALASRTPLLDEFRVPFATDVAERLDLPTGYDYSRPPVAATVDGGALGQVTVVGVHLKSKRPDMPAVTYADTVPWADRLRDTMARQASGLIRSMRRRGAEAAALYDHLAGLLTEDPTRGFVVLGDLNDGVDSVALDALTQRGPVFKIGADGPANWPEGTERNLHGLRLADTAILTANPEGAPRRATHFHEGVPGVLDYALVSNALNPRNPQSRGRPKKLRVLDAHIAEPKRANSTDHAVLALLLEARNQV
jgi:hypothetical protein